MEPIAVWDRDGRLARLQRKGLARLPRRRLSAAWFESGPPRLLPRRSVVSIVLEERGEGR